MQTFNREPILTGGFGAKNPHQWWVRSIPEGDVLAHNPTSFGLDLAMKIKNDKARFTVMIKIFLNLVDQKDISFPGCQKVPGVCIIDELTAIADRENDEWDRDTMYGFLSEMARLQGDQERSEEFLAKITDLKRTQCAYDMCEGGTVRTPRLKSDIPPKRPSILDDLFADKIEFNLIPTPYEDLAKSLQTLSNRLNDTNEDFRGVSSQSGYRIGYLSKHPVSVSSNRRLEPCEID